MTLDDLSQMQFKRREITWISRRIAALSNLQHITTDSVHSAADFPYSKRSIQISGTDITELNRVQKKIRQLKARRRKLDIELDEYDSLVEELGDSEIRLIVEFKFIRGLSWNAVAQKVYDYPCGDRARKRIERYFQKK